MSSADKHIFAIYTPNLWKAEHTVQRSLIITDPEIVHRLVKVLRIEAGQRFIFFDDMQHGEVEITTISKKDFSVKIISLENNIAQALKIRFLLPLLKKEALEEAVYSLAEIGVFDIQLVVTQKSRQRLLHEKEFQRLEAIVVSAAEQSKNYIFPKIYLPVLLSEIEYNDNDQKFVFDPEGVSVFELKSTITEKQPVVLTVGPEAGFIQEELQKLGADGFKKCRLTPTILRAVQAVAIGVGLFRSF